jgi:hypothetical protein
MADNTNDRGEPDHSLIAMGEDYEVRYWTDKFGVTAENLQRAVDTVGNSADSVEAYFVGAAMLR